MQSFIRISSLIKILFLEFVGAAALASIIASLHKHFGGFGCVGSYNEIDISFFIALLLGLFILGWVFLRSFYPKVIQEEFRPILKLGLGNSLPTLLTPNPTIKPSTFSFYTNHPLYFFVQLINIFFVYFFVESAKFPPSFSGCAFLYSWVFSRAFFLILIFFIFIRLGSWFLLQRKISSTKKFDIWKSIIILWCFVAIIPLLYFIFNLQDLKKIKNLPLVTSENISDNLKNNSENSNSFVNLKLKTNFEKPLECSCDIPNTPNCVNRYIYSFELKDNNFITMLSGIDLENKKLLSLKPGSEIELTGKIKPFSDAIKNIPSSLKKCFDLIPSSSKKQIYLELGQP